MTEAQDLSTVQLRELLKSAEETLFGLEFCTCTRCMETDPQEMAFWIDQTLALRREFRVELARRGENLEEPPA
jgi:hypothetical protein